MPTGTRLLLLAALVVMSAGPALAQVAEGALRTRGPAPTGTPRAQAAATDDPAADHGPGEHHDDANHLGVFLGETRQLKHDKLVGFTVGLDYERKLSRRFGIVGRADFVTGDHKRTALFNAAIAWHPGAGFRLALGPGFERVETDRADGGSDKKTYFVLATGLEYAIHLGAWSLSPTVWVDFIGETKTNIAYGVAVGRGF